MPMPVLFVDEPLSVPVLFVVFVDVGPVVFMSGVLSLSELSVLEVTVVADGQLVARPGSLATMRL